jgi:hypothetical protein
MSETDYVRAELVSLQRLEGEFSRHRSEFQRTRDDVLALNGEISNLKTLVQGNIGDLRAAISGVITKFDEKSKTNWPAIALAVSMVPAVWLFVTTYTQNALSPTVAATSLNAEALKRQNEAITILQQSSAGSTSSDIASRADRQQLNDRLRLIEAELGKEIGDRRAISAEFRVSLAEIESQFHALSNLENLRAAQQEQLNALMWEKSHPGERYPNGTFFPAPVFRDQSSSNTQPP